MNKPFISIITVIMNPIRNNRQDDLYRCIESIHKQTFEDFEHIIIDGKSDDGTIAWLTKVSKKYPIKIFSEKDHGIYDAMNRGIKIARGEYISFINSDDYYHRLDAFADLHELLTSNIDFTYGPIRMARKTDQSEYYLKRGEHPQLNPHISNVFSSMPFSHQSMTIKRAVIIDEGLFNPNYQIAGDYNLTLGLCLKNYNSVKLKKSYVTFSVDGKSNKEINSSIAEMSNIYYQNYKSVCKDITHNDVKNIFKKGNLGLPSKLIPFLKKSIYFNESEYMDERKNSKDIIYLIRQIYNKNEYLLPNKVAIHIKKITRTIKNKYSIK